MIFRRSRCVKSKYSFFWRGVFLFLSCLLLGGVASIISGQDSSFDLLNYHLYIPYSLLNDRWHIDLIPAGMHTFFNPLLDVPYYLLFSHLMYWPRLTAFIQGMWYGVFVFFVILL